MLGVLLVPSLFTRTYVSLFRVRAFPKSSKDRPLISAPETSVFSKRREHLSILVKRVDRFTKLLYNNKLSKLLPTLV